MIRIAVAEDSAEDQELLSQHIRCFAEKTDEAVSLSIFHNGMELLEAYRPELWDLVMLDIEMPVLDGLSAAQELRRLDTDILIMFITNMAQYALKGYEVDALDYVLKPLSYYAFALKLKKVQRILREKAGESRMLLFDGELRRVPVQSILYIEVADHKLCYHTYEGESVVTGSLKTLERDLAGCHFTRCNNCYLVNLIHVRKVTTDQVWIEDTPLKISRPRRKEFMDALSAYYGGGGR